MALFERGYGLIIGVGEYSDPAWNVPIAERDARAIHAALTDPQAGGYPPGQVDLLTDAEASSNAALRALERLAARADHGDTVVIAITSHGALSERNLYTLATSDAAFVDGERIKHGTGLTITQLANALQAIRAERLLLVINACFAGYTSKLAAQGGLREMPSGAALPNAEGDTLLGSGKGRALITASRADQRSYFLPDDTHSIFGQALVDGLRGVGISPRSGYIGLFDLYTQVHQQTSRLSAMRGTPQEPMLSLLDGAGPFPVALYVGAEQRDERLIAHERPAAARIVQINIGTQNIDSSTNIDNRRIGADFNHSQLGDVRLGDAAGGNINDLHLPGVTNIDSLIDRLLPSRRPPDIIIPPFSDPPPVDTSTPPDDGGGPLIDFGSAQIGSINFKGDVVRGNVSKTVYNQGGADDEDSPAPPGDLQKIRARVEQARNVDEDARDDAANKIRQAQRAIDQGDRARAIQRIAEALEILDGMNNGYINSLARKLRNVRDALA